MQPASAKRRSVNFVIDYWVFPLVAGAFYAFIFELLSISQIYIELLIVLISFLHPMIMEYFFGQTIGKFITGTRVVTSIGTQASFGQIMLRTLARLVPFDTFSYFVKNPVGWHDSLSQTMVVDKKQYKKISSKDSIVKKQKLPMSNVIFVSIVSLVILASVFVKWQAIYEVNNYMNSTTSELVLTDKSEQNSVVIDNLYRNKKYNFRIKFPEGWEIKTGDGPNIVQKAVSENRTISILIKEFSSDETENMLIGDMYDLSELENELVGEPDGRMQQKIIDSGETKLDNTPSFWVKTSMSYSAADIDVEMTSVQYFVLYKNILYSITASTSSDDFDLAESYFMKTISSFVIEDYENSNITDVESSPDAWQEYFLYKDKFKISLPEKPVEGVQVLDVDGEAVSFYTAASSDGNTSYEVFYADISDLYAEKYEECSGNPYLCSYEKKNNLILRDDLYQSLFSVNNGFREIENYDNYFKNNSSLVFLWKSFEKSGFIKGRLILINNREVYLLFSRNDTDDFSNLGKFVDSWESYGKLSE